VFKNVLINELCIQMRLRLENIYRGGFEDIRLNNYKGKYINGLSLTHSIV